MLKSLITEARVTLSSERTRRNVADITIGTDLTTSTSLNCSEYSLGLSGGSSNTKNLGSITEYLLVQTSDPIDLALSNNGSTTTMTVTNLFILTASVTQAVVINNSLSVTPTVKVIAS